MKSKLFPTALRIVIPCHNCGQWITECLESIVTQDFENWTVLVADDASTDDTTLAAQAFLDDPRITLRTLPERTWLMGNTLSALDEVAPGPADVVAIVDGDDRLLPGALSAIWEAHSQGYDVVWTDMDIQGITGSTGAALIPGVPVRQQLWCLSQLRSFKGYLLEGLDREAVNGADGRPVRAGGDLALYFQLIERAGMWKTHFLPERLYWYRVHPGNNCTALRGEQLANNRRIRALPPLPVQTSHFDIHIEADGLEKLRLRAFGQRVRAEHPLPLSVCVHHGDGNGDGWTAYDGLWIAEGVFLTNSPMPRS
ncbi:glycosyltransferase involved in cell wall biosynthesis [Desulfobaculum xiamenense]|uniref:Glycosyltransferase involved in cell wall biosynthesis n=1 Tax=Desulfobaculum xiamenense TaxID=995050 RepID=A0A846QFQ6_9BACT|nr:glycosyltransferase family 2 protein [Desulfobaculum xiamenense]NJB67071.1 glycosyltransferase involved in cell wall biosynthesis [Desulfobaculum xiamenense]